jgi:hypothetical protein
MNNAHGSETKPISSDCSEQAVVNAPFVNEEIKEQFLSSYTFYDIFLFGILLPQ